MGDLNLTGKARKHALALNRWKIEPDVQGHLEWSVQPIARRLDSLFYSPK